MDDAIAAMERVAAEMLPQGYQYEWTGMAYQEVLAGNQAIFAFALALIFIYLFMVAQYESWLIPISIILVVPVATLGSFITLNLMDVLLVGTLLISGLYSIIQKLREKFHGGSTKLEELGD